MKDYDLYKEVRGRTIEEDFRVSSLDEIIDQCWKQSRSKYRLRFLGAGEQESWITEESRSAHMHIIGTTGVGKSYLLLRQMIEDINRGNGFCFLDPSFQGNTMRMVLSYCARVGHKKVLVIDPHSRKIVPLNLFKRKKQNSIEQIYSTIRVLFDMRNQAQFSFIEHYMPALIGVLHNSGMTLHEALYFSSYSNRFYRNLRELILDNSRANVEGFDVDGIVLEEAFSSPTRYTDFGSTIRRLNPFYRHDTLKLMFGSRQRIKFTDLIADGWVILVNLHRGQGMSGLHAKLLGTAVINEVIYAIHSLKTRWELPDGTTREPWAGRYYLYIDEAGEFANDKLMDLLYYHRQAGLAVILAHQINAQFATSEIKEAVQGLTRIKVAFYQTSYKDRMETAKALYGGSIPDREAEFALKKLRQQHAVIMTDDRDPKFVMIPDTLGSKKVPDDYLREIYSQDFYQDRDDIIRDQRERLRDFRLQTEPTPIEVQNQLNETRATNHIPPRQAPQTNRQTTRQGRVQQQQDTHQGWDDLFQ